MDAIIEKVHGILQIVHEILGIGFILGEVITAIVILIISTVVRRPRNNCTLYTINFIFFVGFIFIVPYVLKFTLNEIDEIETIMDEGFTRNQKRLRNLHIVCHKYYLGKNAKNSSYRDLNEPHIPHYEVFYYDLERKLTWCPIYEAGSTVWLHNFARLGGISERKLKGNSKDLRGIVRSMFPALKDSAAKIALENSLKFMVVRHPFERILSAYRDKLENIAIQDETYHVYQTIGRKIVEKYRPGGNKTNIRLILKKNQYIWDKNKEPIGVEPSFKEFVSYLIDSDLNIDEDDHWIPYYSFCTPCLIRFNIIGKVGTMYDDQVYIIFKVLGEYAKIIFWRYLNKFSLAREYNQVSEAEKAAYFSQLTTADIDKLYDKYQLDFHLYQYNVSRYFRYATVGSQSRAYFRYATVGSQSRAI